jgi:sigma-B regulation protein RsbU (phosphoserine phosphatase)
LTARASAKDKVEGFASGGSDYLTKPVDVVELAVRVRIHIELSQNRRRLQEQARQLREIVAGQSVRLDQVRQGQESLLANPKEFSDLNVAVRFIPAFEAGGDFYDIVRLNESSFGFFVADVAGHDLGTAYLTGALKALTVSFANEAMSVDDTILMMNSSLGRFLGAGQYATLCYMKYLRSRSQIEIINAGHPYPILQQVSGQVEVLDMTGDVLGIHDTVVCNSRSIPVAAGERLFIYTDGLIESYSDPEGRMGKRIWGVEKLVEQISNRRGDSLENAVNSIIDDLVKQCDGRLEDDVVLMAIEF